MSHGARCGRASGASVSRRTCANLWGKLKEQLCPRSISSELLFSWRCINTIASSSIPDQPLRPEIGALGGRKLHLYAQVKVVLR